MTKKREDEEGIGESLEAGVVPNVEPEPVSPVPVAPVAEKTCPACGLMPHAPKEYLFNFAIEHYTTRTEAELKAEGFTSKDLNVIAGELALHDPPLRIGRNWIDRSK